jgi:hypothetical protein
LAFSGYLADGRGDKGGLSYRWIDGWKGGSNPGADYVVGTLIEPADGFYLKTGLDLGVKFGSFYTSLNAQMKIFPSAFGAKTSAVVNDGTDQRTITVNEASWFIPAFTLGLWYYIK